MGLIYEGHEEWTYGMECELPYDVRFSLSEKPTSITFLEVRHNDKAKVRLYADMGDEVRTVEMITEPIKIGEKAEREKNLKIMAFLICLLKKWSGIMNVQLIEKDIIEKEFSFFTSLYDGEFKDYKIVLLVPKVYVIKTFERGNQISFGMPFSDIELFFEEYERIDKENQGTEEKQEIEENKEREDSFLWWGKNRYEFSGGNDLDKKIYNYIMCTIVKLAEVKGTCEDVTGFNAKNAWGLMPRIAPAALLEHVSSREVKREIYNAIMDNQKFPQEVSQKSLEFAREYLVQGKGSIGGHSESIRQTLPDEKMLMVFEVRIPNMRFSEYFAFDKYSIAVDEKLSGTEYANTNPLKDTSESDDSSTDSESW